jgi:predicted DCC family thiol-disulfide oxidoreductase YuxK
MKRSIADLEQSTPPHPVLVFDGVCGLCNASVDFVIRHDRRGVFRFTPSQSEVGRSLLERFGVNPDDVQTVYLVEGGRIKARSTAALLVARRLGFPWSLASVFLLVPRPLRDLVYRWIARNRYRWFGKKETCRLPNAEERARFLLEPEEAGGVGGLDRDQRR